MSDQVQSNHAPGIKPPLLSVKDLVVGFGSDEGVVQAVRGVSFSVVKGEIVGVVGESGCGKSVTALSLLRLLPYPAARIMGGSIEFQGENIVDIPVAEMSKLRGNKIAMIFQEPMTALNPVMTVGNQLIEAVIIHDQIIERQVAKERCLSLLDKVGISEGESRFNQFPHQLSGGMRQRVMIAMALACDPELLIADEPTTALDVTVQAQILDLIIDLQKESGMGVIFITHDLGVVSELCDRVVVMYRGRVIEEGKVADIFSKPSHPYTRGLMRAIPTANIAPKTKLDTIEGSVPAISEKIEGCAFANRCAHSSEECRSLPAKEQVGPEHFVVCHHWRELL